MRSRNNWKRPIVTAGSEKIRRKATTSTIHTNTGIRIIVMPGARITKAVVMKFAEDAIEATPSNSNPTAQKSIRTTSVICVDNGAYPTQEPSGAPPRKNDE